MSQVEVFIFSEEEPAAIKETVSIFTGQSSHGMTCRINVIDPRKCGAKEDDCASWDPDYTMVIDAFSRADEDSYVIVCKDTAVTALQSETILDAIESAIKIGEKEDNAFDLFYMAKWLDRCDQFTNFHSIGGRGLQLVNTVSPNGVLCILFSPRGRKKFLHVFDPKSNPVCGRPLGLVLNSRIGDRHHEEHDVSAERFYAVTTTPSLINFNIAKRSSDKELAKTIECRDIPSYEQPCQKKCSNNMSVFWFVVIVVIIVLLAWALIRLGAHWSAPTVKHDVFGTPLTTYPTSLAALSVN